MHDSLLYSGLVNVWDIFFVILCAIFVMLSFYLLQKGEMLYYLTNENEQTFILKIHQTFGISKCCFYTTCYYSAPK